MAFLAILFLLQVFPSLLFASGLAVQPATFLFRDIPIGEKIRLSVPLSVHNKDSESHTYVIAPLLPSSIGMSWPEGYTEIPDATWFAFEKREITIAGGGIGSVAMYIEIPAVDAYYNQKWVIGLGVTAKVESGESIALAVYPRFLIETESHEGIKGRPAGQTGVRPGILTLSLQSGMKKGGIEIYNNDKISHTYKLRPLIPQEGNSRILPTPSYDWIPDSAWIMPDKSDIRIEPGESRIVNVNMNFPQEKYLVMQRWEALLFITPDSSPATFVRVLLTQ